MRYHDVGSQVFLIIHFKVRSGRIEDDFGSLADLGVIFVENFGPGENHFLEAAVG